MNFIRGDFIAGFQCIVHSEPHLGCAVSFIGVDPYIQYNQKKQVIGGAEFEIIDTYAKAYGFTPKLRREPTYDKSSWDVGGETIIRGMVGSVGRSTCLYITQSTQLNGHLK